MFESVYNGDHDRFLPVCGQTPLHYVPFGGWAVENYDQTNLASQTSLVTKLEKYSRTPTKNVAGMQDCDQTRSPRAVSNTAEARTLD